MGVEMQAVIGQAATDQEAREKILAAIAQSFQIRAITSVRPKKRTSIWDTYADGFRTFLSRFDNPIAE